MPLSQAIALRLTEVSAPEALKRPRHHVVVVVAVVIGENTRGVVGGVGLRELVLSAPLQPETSKTGEASGASAFTRQQLRAS